MRKRYLSKSRFKLAMECPGKLYYTGKKDYANKQVEDSFLQALAEGGFQVGELAKLYHPGGHDIETLDYDLALERTNELLKQDSCIIYEAAIKYQDFFIRVDILVKEGNKIKIMEVKSKSIDLDPDLAKIDPTLAEAGKKVFLTKGRTIRSVWKPYIYDIAFQGHVASQALEGYEVTPYLMLVDKKASAPTDGLNQKFKISRDESGRKYAIASNGITRDDLSEKLLAEIDVEEVCQIVYESKYSYLDQELNFLNLLEKFGHQYKNDLATYPKISSSCKSCEFRASQEERLAGLRSGYHECFEKQLDWTDQDFEEAPVFDLWDNRNLEKHLGQGLIKLSQLEEGHIGLDQERLEKEKEAEKQEETDQRKEEENPGLSRRERQWLQIEKYRNKDGSVYIDRKGLKKELASWIYPYHFIDFETAMPAIPFNRGRRPYEGIAFQFSHHLVHKDGTIEHRSQYLNTNPGEFPNYEFLRELKAQLEGDQGTIFRYAAHENTYLNMIYEQLAQDRDLVEDAEELLDFIVSITQPPSDRRKWKTMARPKTVGDRNMVDMLDLVKKYYYDPYMKGSNSIKVVLPAILNSSDFIREKYSEPIYGIGKEIKSLNFPEKTWVEFHEGQVRDPYDLLPPLFEDLDQANYDLLDREDKISDGGAAMTAYERLQFEDMPDEIRDRVAEGLKKYCELDTLAMVMIYEAWREMVD